MSCTDLPITINPNHFYLLIIEATPYHPYNQIDNMLKIADLVFQYSHFQHSQNMKTVQSRIPLTLIYTSQLLLLINLIVVI